MLNVQVGNLFDLFQRKQYVEALRIANSILQRAPHNPTVQTLKCHILFYLNRKQEALELARASKGLPDLDDMSVRRLQYFFKLIHKPEEFCAITERTYNKQPTESTGKLFFLSYVEAEMFESQTQVCLLIPCLPIFFLLFL